MDSKYSSSIELPLTLVLTAEGEFFYNQYNPPLGVLKNEKTSNANQVSFTSFSAGILKKMILAGFISQIKVTRTDFNAKRNEIIDLAKLISYGVLMNCSTFKLADSLNRTSLLSQWNRRHPTKTLNASDMIALYAKKALIPSEIEARDSAMRHILLYSFNSSNAKIKNISSEERKMLLFKAKNYLSHLDSRIWILMIEHWNSSNCNAALILVGEVLWNYLQKTDIADYLSLLIMELASLVEKALIRKAVTTYLGGKVDMEHFVKNENDRNRVFKTLRAKNETASLFWQIRGKSSKKIVSNSLNFSVNNHISESETVLKSLDKSSMKTHGKSLASFYGEHGNEESEIGLFYLNYLQEECRHLGVTMNTYTSQSREQDISSVNLLMRF